MDEREPTQAEWAEAERRFRAGWSFDPLTGWKRPQGRTSNELSPAELRAVKRIWPGIQLEFNLERHNGQ